MMNSSRGTPPLGASLVVLALLAACGSGADASSGLASLNGGQAATTTTTADASQADSEEAALEFAQCMRDNGVTDFPDPSFGAGGGGFIGGTDGAGSGIDFQSDEVQAAFEACGEILEGAVFGGGGGDFDPTELQDNLLALAQCLRDQGLDVDDPDLSNFGPAAGGPPPAGGEEGGGSGAETQPQGPFGDIDLSDPDVQEAMDFCQQEVGFGAGGGPGGGPGGAGAGQESDEP